jgi:DNA polymerase
MEPAPDHVVDACQRCPELVESRSRIVNGMGPDSADLLFVGEAPGEQEDAEGAPFVGRSGDILDEVLRDHGLARSDVRITNCVKCRPPDNRDPTDTELANCRSYLEAEIAAVDPTVVVTLGKVPTEHLLDRSVTVTTEAGRVERATIGGTQREVLICVHPAASLYDPTQRDTLEAAIATAATMAGTSQQSRLGEY